MHRSDINGCFLILVVSFGLCLGINALSPAGIPLKGQWNPEKGVVMADPDHYSQTRVQELHNPLKLLRMIQSGKLVLIDARQSSAYARGHLPGALCFPLHEFNKNLSALGRSLTFGLPVVVYCSGVDCQDSHKFAAKLLSMGVETVMVYGGGFNEWSEMGFEVVTGEG